MQAFEDQFVCIRIIDLVSSPFGASIDAEEGNTRSKLTIERSTPFFDVRTSLFADNVGIVASFFSHSVGIFIFAWLVYGARYATVLLNVFFGIDYEGSFRRSEMMLEEQIVSCEMLAVR